MLPRPQYSELQLRAAQETIERRKRMNMYTPTPPKLMKPEKTSSPLDFVFIGDIVIEIQKIVCRHLYIQLNDLVGASHLKRFVRPRQMAILLCHEFTNKSTLSTAHRFNIDHTSVIYAVKKAKRLLEDDPMFNKVAELLREIIKTELKDRMETARA